MCILNTAQAELAINIDWAACSYCFAIFHNFKKKTWIATMLAMCFYLDVIGWKLFC